MTETSPTTAAAQAAGPSPHTGSVRNTGGAPSAGLLDTIPEAVAAIAAGRPIVVVDDEDRENEGDLIIAAEFADSATMGFIVRHSSGVVCAPMTVARAEALRLPPMVTDNEDPKGTAYTISCDAVGVTTGISAEERALTGRVLAAADPDPEAISRPGHVFPLIAKDGGVRERPGHTEAGVEFARLAGARPVSMIAEVVHDDGSMMRFDALRKFATENGLVMVSIEQLIDHLGEVEAKESDGAADDLPLADAALTGAPAMLRPAEMLAADASDEVPLPTKYGSFTARAFTVDGQDHLGVYTGLGDDHAPLVRVHSECMTGDVFGSHRCDCGEQLDLAMRTIAEEGGAVVYLTGHEGRGIGLSNKIRAYALQDSGLDTVDANLRLGLSDDARDYRAAAAILTSMGLTRIRLLTNNPTKTQALEALGITVEEVVPLEIPARPENAKYLATKQTRMHHTLHLAG